MSNISLVRKNKNVELYSYVSESGKNNFKEYFISLPADKQKKFINRFDMFLAKDGKLFNEEQFKYLQEGIYEFKIHGERCLCFVLQEANPKQIVITHGFPKRTNSPVKKSEIKKAIKIQNKCFEKRK